MTADTRVERHLGWVTMNGQRYPREKADDWLDAVKKQLCPFCGEGPFTVVAQHVRHRHGLNRHEFRDLLGITDSESICDPFHSAARREHGKRVTAGRDMRALVALRSGNRRMTVAARAAHDRSRKERSCVVCGIEITGERRTCSDECRRQRQSETAKATRAQDVRTVEMLRFVCPECGQTAEKRASQVRSNRKQGWDGPFCTMSCAGKYRQRKRYGDQSAAS